MTGKRPEIMVRRPVGGSGLPFTGERFVPSVTGEIEIEHVHRYLFAVPLVQGLDVLDIASGEGYGSAILAQTARSVVGVDIDPTSVEHAQRTYSGKSVRFVTGSCESIPADDGSFDVVVSFETIEHVAAQERFLDEVRRVLRPGGIFLCSTPDPTRYRVGSSPNPFHQRELSRGEFEALIAARFPHHRTLGQKLSSGSVISPLGDDSTLEIVSTTNGVDYQRGTLDDRAVYLLSVASDGPVDRLATSVLTDLRYSVGQVTDLRTRVSELISLKRQLAESREQVDLLRSSLVSLESQRADADQRAEAAGQESIRLLASLEAERAARASVEQQRDASLRAFSRTLRERDAVRDTLNAELDGLRDRLAVAEEATDSVRQELGNANTSLCVTRTLARESERMRSALANTQAELRAALTLMETRARHAEGAAADQTIEIEWMRSTRSWRWTGWLRRRSGQTRTMSVRAAGLLARGMTLAGLPGAERARIARRAAMFRASRLFDGGYYLARYPDVAAAGLDPAWHYAARGATEGRDPSPRFSTHAYLDMHRDVAAAGVNPLEHYLSRGQAEGRAIVAPGASSSERVAHTPRALVEPMGPAMLAELFRASAFFDAEWYLRQYPDVAAAGCDPARHYAARGVAEARNPSDLFDTAYYLSTTPPEVLAGMHPLEHFLLVGQAEARAPRAVGSQTTGKRPTRIEVTERHARPCPRIETNAAQLARTKALAFYLPQFHPIAENDAWWGKGFTEWTNVTRARAMFPGHAQPILPGELGFYDLRLSEVRDRQAELARSAGIHGFCYYHYWFNGRRLLERPLDAVVKSGQPDFPFCICWANENWTRRWDGQAQQVLLEQRHSLSEDRRFMLDLLPYLEDPRYVRVDGRPVVVVYRPDLMVNAADTAAVWRDECSRAGIGDIHLCAVQFRTSDPGPLGFDAAVEFPPHHFPAPEITGRIDGLEAAFGGSVFDYRAGVLELIERPRRAEYRLYRGVMPSWDNTARRMEQSLIYHGADPDLYEAWLRSAINQPQPADGITENLVFINAWNEWAEGTVLEPRRDLGYAYLRATARALGQPYAEADQSGEIPAETPEPVSQGGSLLEAKIKRVVRTNATLNSFVNRHPELKNKAAGLVRKIGSGTTEANTSSASTRVAWRGRPANQGGPRLLVVSHDAALAGAQLILLENLRHWTRAGVDCRVLLLGSGVLEPAFSAECPTVCGETLRGLTRSQMVDAVLDDLATTGWKPDAAFCNTVASVDAMSVLKARGTPVVSAVYELPTSIDDSLGGRRCIERVLAASARVMVASAFVRDRLSEAYGLDPSRLLPIHTGVLSRDLPEREEARRRVRRELDVSDDTVVVLGCGSIHHRKGTDLFVAAAGAARRTGTTRPIVFVWVGEDQSGPTFGNWCRHDAERLGVTDMVRFVGKRDDPTVWFAGSDLFALTSREDPFPMVCLEALAAGLGVVGFEGAGGAPEALRPDRGVVVGYLDTNAMGIALAGLADHPDELDSLRCRALQHAAEGLGWDRYMRDIHRLLASVSEAFVGAGAAR
jgi:glycosyltransferase involved in cell wall biosynthesis/SAM-dependent methyltransferase